MRAMARCFKMDLRWRKGITFPQTCLTSKTNRICVGYSAPRYSIRHRAAVFLTEASTTTYTLWSLKRIWGGSSIPSLINNRPLKFYASRWCSHPEWLENECNSRVSLNFQDHNITSNLEITSFRTVVLRDRTSLWPQSGHVTWRSQKEQRHKKKANDGCCCAITVGRIYKMCL